MPKLICISGMNKGEEYNLPVGKDIMIGRSEKNEICVFDKKSSRRHCKLHVKEDGEIIIEDLNSTNGLRVNNEFISGSLAINIGDHIRIGQTVFLVSDRPMETVPGEEDESTSSALLRKQKKYENLLQKTAFQVTKTTTLRKLKSEKEGRDTGFLSFFESNDES